MISFTGHFLHTQHIQLLRFFEITRQPFRHAMTMYEDSDGNIRIPSENLMLSSPCHDFARFFLLA
jgi:hypothetical protein